MMKDNIASSRTTKVVIWTPYLVVYRAEVSAIMSILERMTGGILVFVVIFGYFFLYFDTNFCSVYMYYNIVLLFVGCNYNFMLLNGFLMLIYSISFWHIIMGLTMLKDLFGYNIAMVKNTKY